MPRRSERDTARRKGTAKSKTAKRARARTTAVAARTRPAKAPADRTTPGEVVLRTDRGAEARIPIDKRLERAAMSWSYRVRNRIRWNMSARGRRAQAEQCVEVAKELGLSKEALEGLAAGGLVEVTVPYATEHAGWAARVFPWEYFLSGATYGFRAHPSTIVRHLRREALVPEARERSVLAVVTCAPGRTAGLYDLTSEKRLAPERLGIQEEVPIENPSLKELRAAMARHQPDVVHVGGIDTHQGAELLGLPDAEVWDGVLLARGSEEDFVTAHEVALALNAGGQRPWLVVFNLYHSAARLAALTVAEGAASALGFQDTFDDLAAELFIGDFYRALAATRGDLLVAFQAGWEALADFDKPLAGTGIVLWSARALLRDAGDVRKHARKEHAAIELARGKEVEVATEADARKLLSIRCEPVTSLNYSLLHNRRPLFQRFELRKAPDDRGAIPEGKVPVTVEVELAGVTPYCSTEEVADLGVDTSTGSSSR